MFEHCRCLFLLVNHTHIEASNSFCYSSTQNEEDGRFRLVWRPGIDPVILIVHKLVTFQEQIQAMDFKKQAGARVAACASAAAEGVGVVGSLEKKKRRAVHPQSRTLAHWGRRFWERRGHR